MFRQAALSDVLISIIFFLLGCPVSQDVQVQHADLRPLGNPPAVRCHVCAATQHPTRQDLPHSLVLVLLPVPGVTPGSALLVEALLPAFLQVYILFIV